MLQHTEMFKVKHALNQHDNEAYADSVLKLQTYIMRNKRSELSEMAMKFTFITTKSKLSPRHIMV